MHLETYLYMLLQSSEVRSPPTSTKPDFRSLATQAELNAVPNQWFRVPKNEIQLGLEDPENDRGPDRYFGWDNEKPSRVVNVAEFEAQGRPITNSEYARYLKETHATAIPASWIRHETNVESLNGFHGDATENGSVNIDQDHMASGDDWIRDVSLRTVYGFVPFQYALHWPVMASYDELAAYAKWADGRIPTLEEVRSIYSYVEAMKQDVAEKVSSSLISAVNG